MKNLLLTTLAFSVIALCPATVAALTESEKSDLFNQMLAANAAEEAVILALVDREMSLSDATAYAVQNSAEVTGATSFTYAGICLAADEWLAQTVAEAAINNAKPEAVDAVKSRAQSTLSHYGTEGCQGLVNSRRGALPPFGTVPKSAGSVSTDL